MNGDCLSGWAAAAAVAGLWTYGSPASDAKATQINGDELNTEAQCCTKCKRIDVNITARPGHMCKITCFPLIR